MSKYITWLHLSDLHALKPEDGWKSNKIIMTLIDDLTSLENNFSLSPDLIFFTGDLAMGIKDYESDIKLDHQFDEACLFLDLVRNAFTIEVPKSSVFIVPGNHDINRNRTGKNQKLFLDKATTEDISKIVSANGYEWQRYMDRQKQYQSFLRRAGFNHLLSGQDKDHGIFSTVREFHGSYKINLCGFNSAWSSSSDNEKGSIWIGADYQLASFFENINKSDMSIALIHHPVGWLVAQEEPHFRERLTQEFSFCLHGHEHYEWVDLKDGHTQIGAGASFSQTRDEIGYNFVRLNIEDGTGEIWLRKYQEDGWFARNLHNTDSKGVIHLRRENWEKQRKIVHHQEVNAPVINETRPNLGVVRTISDVINDREPFGPYEAKEIKDYSIMRELFDQNNQLYSLLKKRPSIIEGRRGSGKTTFLHMVDLNKTRTLKIFLQDPEIIELLLSEINEIMKSSVLVESCSRIWRTIFLVLIGHEILTVFPDNCLETHTIFQFLGSFGISASSDLKDTINHFFNSIKRTSTKKANLKFESGGIKYSDFELIVDQFLKQKQYDAIILIDSFDEYKRLIESVAFAFQGLLKCVGEFNSQFDKCNLLMCIPTELHNEVESLSSNPTKDFSRELILQWHSKELLSIIASRYKKYCEIYRPELFQKMVLLNTSNKKDARSILLLCLPEYVENILGEREDVFSYIMRHTQLQPRQLIQLMNKIVIHSNGDQDISPISVREAIHGNAEHIINEIYSAYKLTYPDAKDICESCLPNLPFLFRLGDLQETYTRHGKKYFSSGSFDKFYKMFIEMGIIGRVIKETEQYHISRFEFTVAHRLFVTYDDTLCLHPLFSGYYWNDSKKSSKRIFPYGCGFEDSEFREWLEN